MKKNVVVAVTGAAGQIGYAILPRLASGEVFGHDTSVTLRLLEVPQALPAVQGVVMELEDCAFPLLKEVTITDDPKAAFEGVNWALLIGSKPRAKGMERGELIRTNGPIFVNQGKAIASEASENVRVLVVGNPANTNCLIAMSNAKKLPSQRFGALTMLDQNRAVAALAAKANVPVTAVTNMAIWGNHSSTQYPDFENARINGRPVPEVIANDAWLRGEFIETIQKRGAAILAARGLSSAASAANAALDHVKNFERATPEGDWFSAAVPSDGSYGIGKGLIFSFPIRSDGKGGYSIVQGLKLSDFAREKIEVTTKELVEEKAVVADLL